MTSLPSTYAEVVAVEHRDGVAVLRLARAERRNALSATLCNAIDRVLEDWALDDAVRAVVVTGDGPAFCAGFDLTEVADSGRQRRLVDASSRYHRTVWSFPKPLVCAVNGPALAGGFDLTTLCDLRIASERATFGHPEIKFGMPPLLTPLRWLVGDGVARDLCLTGRTISAVEALSVGLVSRVVAQGELLDSALATAAAIAEAPPQTLAMFKAYASGVSGTFEESFRAEHDVPFAAVLAGEGADVAAGGAARLRELR